MNTVDFTGLIAEFDSLSTSVTLDAAEAADLRERVLDLKAGKALADELERENAVLRDSIVADLLSMRTRKVIVDGQTLTSLSLPSRTGIDWDKLERLAPKALERSRFKTYAHRLTTGRLKAE